MEVLTDKWIWINTIAYNHLIYWTSTLFCFSTWRCFRYNLELIRSEVIQEPANPIYCVLNDSPGGNYRERLRKMSRMKTFYKHCHTMERLDSCVPWMCTYEHIAYVMGIERNFSCIMRFPIRALSKYFVSCSIELRTNLHYHLYEF